MPKFEFNRDEEHEDTWSSPATERINLAVRIIGLGLLIVGLIIALAVITRAWTLFEDPSQIESFAAAVERGSNLDLTLTSKAAQARKELQAPRLDMSDELQTARTASEPEPQATPPLPGLRFSYFVAWLISLLLLMLVGRLSIAAIRTGGELALYDVKVGKLARALLTERLRNSG